MPRRPLLASLIVLLALAPAAAKAGESAPISTAFDPAAIRQQVQRAFRPASGGFETLQSGVRVRFEDGRLSWRSGATVAVPVEFETLSIGRSHGPAPTTFAPRVRLERDGHLALGRGAAVEHLRGVEEGLHQSFGFEHAPAGTGDLEVRLRLHGARHVGRSSAGHHFTSADGLALTYGPATWVEADGRRTPMKVRAEPDGDLVLVVDEATLARSAFPAEIDPIISTRANLDAPVPGYANLSQVQPDVAFDGTHYLVVWQDNRATGGHLIGIDGARVSTEGEVLDPAGFTIFKSLANSSIPAVAFDGVNYVVAAMDSYGGVRVNRVTPAGVVLDGSSGRQVDSTYNAVDVVEVAAGGGVALVAWTNHTPGGGSIRARLVDPSGTALGSTLTLSTNGLDFVPEVAFNGTNFLVAWRTDSRYGAGRVLGMRVAPDGQVLDAAPIALGTAASDRIVVSVAAVGETWLVVWQGASGVVATRVGADGTVLDAAPLALSATTSVTSPTVASDGARFHVAWFAYHYPTVDLTVNRVGLDGAVLDGTGVLLASDLRAEALSAACTASACFVTWSDTQGYDTFGLRVQAAAALDAAPLHVSAAASKQDWPAIARAGDQFLVVWDDYRGGLDRQLWAARVSLTGEVLDPAGIELCTAAADQTMAAVAGTDAGDFFVAWADQRAEVTTYVTLYGTGVLADGTVVTPGGARLTTADDASNPVLASDGTGYLLAWYESSDPSINNVIKASRLSPAGVPLDSPPLLFTPTGGGAEPTVAWGNGAYLVVFEGSGGLRGIRVPATGAPLDAVPGLLVASGEFPSATFDGLHWVVGYRRFDPASSWMNPEYHLHATRLAADGSVLDPDGVQLSLTRIRGYTSAYYRQGPEAGFDGVDSVFTWASNYEGGRVYAAWLSPDGEPFGTSTLVNVPDSIPLTASIAGRGDGDHSLLVHVFGDPTPGIRNFRVGLQEVTFRIDGRACGSTVECKSGYCVDGVCCETECGGGAEDDCQVCSAAAGASLDGVCTPLPAGRACRPASGLCDLADTCDGSSVDCADSVADAATVCRASGGACDPAELCTGASPECPADVFEPTTTACRAAAGACDLAETCAGDAADCPADLWAEAGTVCHESSGPCDPAELCTGFSAACPGDALEPATTVCREPAGPCDLAESCTGLAAACPDDGFRSGELCREAAGPCDVEESCNGLSAECPSDSLLVAGTGCREAAGVCDVAESCTGGSVLCPDDAFASAATSCREAAGPCDLAESCTGSSALCPDDALAPAAVVCRPATGACDVEERCSGSAVECPADAFQLSTVECRPVAGVCDVAESCSGSAAACPADGFEPATVECRAATDVCDAAESCSGSAAACPADGFAAQGTACRPSTDLCDAAEACTGAALACPTDAFEPASTVCRPAADACDRVEQCSGSAPACPSDEAAADGTVCGTNTTCGAAQSCQVGQCVTGEAPSCDDGDHCTADDCTEGIGCTHTPIAGCCRSAADCDDAGACTADTCAAGRCGHQPIEGCCRTALDCTDDDACTADSCVDGSCEHAPEPGCEPAAPAPSGCGCSSVVDPFSAWLGLLGIAAWRRRRRGRGPRRAGAP